MKRTDLVFISSFSREDTFQARADDKLSLLRQSLWEMDKERVWVAEFSESSLADLAVSDPLAVADQLVDRLKAADCVVVILAGARQNDFQTGCPLAVGGHTVATSHFEIELLAAAVSGKPIHLFKLIGFDPGPRLRALLDCLKFAYPAWSSLAQQTESEIKAAVEVILENCAPGGVVGREALKKMVCGLFLERGRAALAGDAEINFLGGEMEIRGGEVNVVQAELALAGGSGFVAGSSLANTSLDVQQRLSRAWIALRELMACSFDPQDSKNRKFYRPELLPLWDRALNAWSGAAAWSSLHGHIYLGPVAALSAVARVRMAARGERKARLEMEEASLLHPYGGYASAYYSIAQRLPFGAARRVYFHALRNANLGLAEQPDDSGLHAVRGSIELRLAHPWRAVADYEKAWKLHPRGRIECPETGQIIIELAFGHLFTGQWIRARRLADCGLAQMRQLEEKDGFLARALRKCARIHKLTGSFRRARALEEEARQIALEGKIFDQIQQGSTKGWMRFPGKGVSLVQVSGPKVASDDISKPRNSAKITFDQVSRGVGDRIDALFGHDFFVSYGRRDAAAYAANLRSALATKRLRSFLDSEDFYPGQELRSATRSNVRKSSAMVLVATPAAACSPHVRAELDLFLKLGRPIVVVNVNRALQQHFPKDLRRTLDSFLWIDENGALPVTEPSGHVLLELRRQTRFTRQLVRRMRIFGVLAILFAMLATGAVYSAYLARKRANLALSRQLVAQARNSLASQPDLALLLATEAYAVAPTTEAAVGVSDLLGQLARLTGQRHAFRSAVESMAHSPGGRYFAAASPQEGLMVWEIATGQLVATLHSEVGGFLHFAFHPDGERIVTCGGSHPASVAVWKIRAPATALAKVTLPNAVRVAFAPDRRGILAGTGDGHVFILDPDTAAVKDLGEAHHGVITAIVPDFARGKFYTAGMSGTKNVAAWNFETLQPEHYFESDRMSINALALSADGALLASGGEEKRAILWNTKTYGAEAQFALDRNRVRSYGASERANSGILSLEFVSGGVGLLAAYDDGQVIVWDLKTDAGGELHTHLGAALALAAQPGVRCFASGGADGKIRFWDLGQVHPTSRLLAPKAGSRNLGFSDDEKNLCAADGNGVRSWNLASGQEQPPVTWPSDESSRVVAFSAGAGAVALASDGHIEYGATVRSGSGFTQVTPIADARLYFDRAAIDPNGRWFCGSSATSPLALWDLRLSRPVAIPCPNATGKLSAVAFSSEGARLIGGLLRTSIMVWDPSTRRVVARIDQEPDGYESPTAVAGNAAARIVVAGYLQHGTIAFWNVANAAHPQLMAVTHEHALRGSITAITFNTAGTRMLSLGSEGDAVLWQMPSCLPLAHLHEYGDGYLRALPFNCAGSRAAAWNGGNLLLYDLSISGWIMRAKELAGRPLSNDERRAFLSPVE